LSSLTNIQRKKPKKAPTLLLLFICPKLPFMNVAHIEEIESYLKHDDCSLAVRRTLDLTLDTGDATLMRRAIEWSKSFRKEEAKTLSEKMPNSFFEEGKHILKATLSISDSKSYTPSELLVAKDISKKYNKSAFSLKPMNLQLNTGNVLGVVGENGNGKTTLLRMLGGQLALDTGNIKYRLLKDTDNYAIKNHVAFIPQRIPKWYGLLKDNLHFSASLAGVHGAENELMVDYMLERLNLTAYAHLDWTRISSGYRTRFEIARVLLQKPQLLILDEPLANLDIKAQQTILTDLIYMAKGAHNPMGIILSSQQLHEVEKVADTVIFIKQGACMYSSSDIVTTAKSTAIEFETTATREQIIEVFATDEIDLHYNGGFYSIIAKEISPDVIMKKLVNSQLTISYFRDITNSTKRFFN
jgi:ABC-2 type transport system ATP-binding protein